MFCFHKFGKVEGDGYQYCTKCGLANLAPVRKCSHSFEILETTERINSIRNTVIGKLYINRCKHCGIIEFSKFSVSDFS